MGSGYFTQLSQRSFSFARRQCRTAGGMGRPVSSTLANRPLLLWHGDEDDVVPPDGTFRLQQALQQNNLDADPDVRLAKVRYRITPEALAATVAFFQQNL